MTIKIFAVYDFKAECYRHPFFMPTTGQAVRAFEGMANDVKSEIGSYPKDFGLFECGNFDDKLGEVSRLSVLVNLGMASDFVRKEGGINE